jgi:EAL domain-containing protein (putative c-di-GMP-specific phosphodiesterase class I)
VNGLGRDPEDSAIVAAVVSLAHALGLSAVAEGVETKDQLRQLRRIDCDLAQGNYFAPPQSAQALEDMFGLETALSRS